MSTLIGGIFKNVKLNKCLEKEKTHNMDLRINHNRLNLFNCNKLLKINKKKCVFCSSKCKFLDLKHLKICGVFKNSLISVDKA